MTKVGYYPGCSLEAAARDYQESIQGASQRLGVELEEIPDWNCCGASAGHSLDHRVAFNLGARNLALAASGPQPVVVPCALCFNRLKTTQAELARSRDLLIPEIAALGGDWDRVEVVELNDYFTSPEIIDLCLSRQEAGLGGFKPVCYYGCQGQRPPKITGSRDYENPVSLDRLLRALGAEPVDWSGKTDCCGASHAAARPDIVHVLAGRLYQRALDVGANCIVTGCQMCQANLDLYQREIAQELGREVYLPVLYFTELMGLALGHPQAARWLGRHLVYPRALMARTELPRQTWERL